MAGVRRARLHHRLLHHGPAVVPESGRRAVEHSLPEHDIARLLATNHPRRQQERPRTIAHDRQGRSHMRKALVADSYYGRPME